MSRMGNLLVNCFTYHENWVLNIENYKYKKCIKNILTGGITGCLTFHEQTSRVTCDLSATMSIAPLMNKAHTSNILLGLHI